MVSKTDIARDFPNARHIGGFEGGVVFAAERDGGYFVIADCGTLADFAEPDDDIDFIVVERFDTAAARLVHLTSKPLLSLVATDPLARRVLPLYDALSEKRIHPFIGARFAGERGVLRVVAIGFNSYANDKPARAGKPADYDRTSPEWYPTWVRQVPEHHRHLRYFAAIRKEVKTIAAALEAAPSFQGLAYDDPESLYVTNVVKEYLPQSAGRHASLVTEADYARSAPIWHHELATMAHQGCLPHLIVAFGKGPWAQLSDSLSDRQQGALSFIAGRVDYERFSVLHVKQAGRERSLFILRLAHPSSWGKKGRAAAMLESPDFRKALGLPA